MDGLVLRRGGFQFRLTVLAAAVVALAAARPAAAFSLGDHTRITGQALDELENCYPGSVSLFERGRILVAVVGEDLNPIKKGLIYSHYFHPYKRIDMLREDSMTSVARAAHEIRTLKRLSQPWRSITGSVAEEAGHLIHHLQDAAVPPHVAPVDHGLSDGFESYEVDEKLFGRRLKESDCAALAARAETLSHEDILSETAIATLRTMSGKFIFHLNGVRRKATWEDAFWRQSKDTSFGRYGFLGNRFGQSVIELRSRRYDIEKDLFVRFKHRQIRLAIEATRLAIYRIYRL